MGKREPDWYILISFWLLFLMPQRLVCHFCALVLHIDAQIHVGVNTHTHTHTHSQAYVLS